MMECRTLTGWTEVDGGQRSPHAHGTPHHTLTPAAAKLSAASGSRSPPARSRARTPPACVPGTARGRPGGRAAHPAGVRLLPPGRGGPAPSRQAGRSAAAGQETRRQERTVVVVVLCLLYSQYNGPCLLAAGLGSTTSAPLSLPVPKGLISTCACARAGCSCTKHKEQRPHGVRTLMLIICALAVGLW